MSPAISSKRLRCAICLRPQGTCICHWVTPITHVVEVVILQHPLEVDNAKGSARLLHLSLPNSRMVTGEVFSEACLQALLSQPFRPEGAAYSPRHTVLLYPDTPQTQALPVLGPACLQVPSQMRLIVLDASWRKSRKMLSLNPLLQQLPRLPLRNMPASQYLIRKAHKPDQLSTLEATCTALMQLESNAEKFQPLLTAFDGFVAQQMGYQSMQERVASAHSGIKKPGTRPG